MVARMVSGDDLVSVAVTIHRSHVEIVVGRAAVDARVLPRDLVTEADRHERRVFALPVASTGLNDCNVAMLPAPA
jgi:hypothetical protein